MQSFSTACQNDIMVKYLNLLKQQVSKHAWQAPDYTVEQDVRE